MNYLIIGLGNFGSALAIRLTELGNEVIAVDKRMEKVEMFKDMITHTICLDCTEMQAASNLPVENTDAVIICIGEDEGDSIMSTALMKQLNVKRIISRAVSPLQQTVIQAMGINEIVHPEQDSAEKLAKNLTSQEYIDSFDLSDDYSIVKVRVPEKYEGKTLKELNLRNEFKLTVLTTLQPVEKRNIIGIKHEVMQVNEVSNADTLLGKNEIMVIFGNVKDIERFLG